MIDRNDTQPETTEPSTESVWKFWIDVGGTFTDCLALAPNGEISVLKVLSSGVVKGTIQSISPGGGPIDMNLGVYPPFFLSGYKFRLSEGTPGASNGIPIRSHDPVSGELRLQPSGDISLRPGQAYEIFSGEPAPLLAIRTALGIGLGDPIGRVEVRLGTTRATNALLERRGAKTAFVTTRGFADVLLIANQDRPSLFDLRIVKPEPLFDNVVEIDERIAADGEILQELDEPKARDALLQLAKDETESLAICLMHAYKNPKHEEVLARLAEEVGFTNVSISSAVSPTIKIVSRGDTTVVDAYLTPVIRDYIDSIARALPEARLTLMTSAGGLAAPASVRGKDVILSGPAGGVVGCAEVAKAAGLGRVIGFDMGGTSTDVSRYDGEFEYEYETTKAGVRIVSPMLAIETVAAGGGSICAYDGQKLVVGPRSAGADPGPACYGRDGPLAITDVNVFLGRVVPEFFPFPLDTAAVATRLAEVADQIEASGGTAMDRAEIAEGFIRIANANMAEAIKKISVEKGYDVREYALVSFGGAAGQHACAIARELGIRKILVHPYASVLSAYGIGMADVRKFAVRTVLEPYSESSLRSVESAFEAMQSDLTRRMVEDGVARGEIQPPLRQLDLHYQGQSSSITVSQAEGRSYAEEFERLHEQLYGHKFQGRAIEIAAARIQISARTEKPQLGSELERERIATPHSRRPVVFGGEPLDTAVHRWEQLEPGDRIEAPALVLESTSTIFLEPGWSGRFSSLGDLILEASAPSQVGVPEESTDAAQPNPIDLEIFHRHFASIAEQMGGALRRTALSVNVKERLDFSCAIFTPEGDLVANAPHVPVHLGAMSECVRCAIEDVPDLELGDILLTNDPMRGGSHLPDVTVITPVFDDESRGIQFFTASRAHHAEIGGIRPGSMPPDSKNLAEEGVLLRNFRIVKAGRPRFDELRDALTAGDYPSRAPEENLADVGAQIAANHKGRAALLELIQDRGMATTQAYMRHIQAASADKMRSSIRALPDGVSRFEDAMDDGTKIALALEVEGDRAKLDFSGTSPVVPGNLNANRAIVHSAVIYCFRCLIAEDIPLNSGVLEPIEIVLPVCFLNPPRHEDPAECPAMVGGNVETSQRIVDVIFGALGVVAASQGTMNNLTFGNDSFGYYETICGGTGAGPDFDGADAVHSHMTNTRLTDPEVLESRFPVRLRRFEILRGSGGEGRHCGGDGVLREIEFLEPLEVSLLCQRRDRPPYGLEGGEPGRPGRNRIFRGAAPDSSEELPGIGPCRAAPGDRLILETPGGGGYGPTENIEAK